MSPGHVTHFLERLERAAPQETDLALSLYNDSQLVSLLLHYIEVPGRFDRIAISLSKDDGGPFIVVNRDGSFVTCLAAGMRIDDLFVISYDRLQHYRAKSEEFSRRLEIAGEISDAQGVESLLDDMAAKGHAVSREEFQAVSVLQPVFKPMFLGLLAEQQPISPKISLSRGPSAFQEIFVQTRQ